MWFGLDGPPYSVTYPEWDVVGIDFNPNYISYARNQSRAASLENLTFEQGDLRALRLTTASFDVVWSRFVLYFQAKPDEAIENFRRIVRPNGEIVIALHNWSTMSDFPEDPDLRDRRLRVFTSIVDTQLAQKLPSILFEYGFRDVCVEVELDKVYSAMGAVGSNLGETMPKSSNLEWNGQSKVSAAWLQLKNLRQIYWLISIDRIRIHTFCFGLLNAGLLTIHKREPGRPIIGVTLTVYLTPYQRPSEESVDAGNAIRPLLEKGQRSVLQQSAPYDCLAGAEEMHIVSTARPP